MNGILECITVPTGGPFASVNVYVLGTEGAVWLIDPGLDRDGNYQHLTRELQELGLSWEDVTGLLITHLHADHMGLVPDLLENHPHLRVRYPAGPAFDRRTPDAFMRWIRRVGIPERHHDRLQDEVSEHPYLEHLDVMRREGDELSIGETLDLGGEKFAVLDARGHTPNQVALYREEDEVLFGGDHLLPDETPNVGLFPEWDGEDPLERYFANLQQFLDLKPDRVLPGHGEPIERPDERIQEVLEHHDQRLGRARRAVEDGHRTVHEVAGQLHWADGQKEYRELDRINGFLALGETLAHLVHLVRTGVLEREQKQGRDIFTPASSTSR